MNQAFFGARVALIDDQSHGLTRLAKHRGKFAVGRGKFASAIDYEDDLRRLVKSHARLRQNLARYIVGIAYDNAAGIDYIEPLAFMRGVAFDAIPRNARLVSYNGTALAGDPVEQRGLTDVRPSHDNDRRHFARHDYLQ